MPCNGWTKLCWYASFDGGDLQPTVHGTSFGIRLGCYFEEEVSAFGCKVYNYDPAIAYNVRRSGNIRYKIGVVVEPTKHQK